VRRAIVLGGLVALVLAAPTPARADADAELAALRAALPACEAGRAHCLAIQLHVTVVDGRPIAEAGWLAAQLAEASRQFAALDVGYQVVAIDSLPASGAHIATRRDRDELATGRLGGGALPVFIVGQLDNVDEAGVIRGVTWRTRRGGRKYVLVSTIAPARTLAHELGHVFGLAHSTYPISIMNKTERADPPPDQRTFADEELAAMRPVVGRLLRAKVIAEVAN
jgi:hypothetical protein